MINPTSSEPEDRLSELPDSLIFDIFGFLPLDDVVRTTILSNRWKNLWTTIPCLTFDDGVMDTTAKFRSFVNGALNFWRGTRIQKFKLDLCPKIEKSLFIDIDSWVLFATDNKVEELCIELLYPYDEFGGNDYISGEEVYWLPHFVYSCSCVKVLSFEGCHFDIDDRVEITVQWNQLKSLTLGGYGYNVSEKMINQFLCGSPRLEVFNLTLKENLEDLNIESSSLKELSISKCSFYYNDEPWTNMMRIWTPNLETLRLAGVPYGKCLLMDVSSLVHVTLGYSDPPLNHEQFSFPWNDFLGERFREIFPTILHVEKVTLSHWCIKVVAAMTKTDPLPLLSSVGFLELNICCFVGYEHILECLENFPEVKILIIQSKPIVSRTPACADHNADQSCPEFVTNLPNSFLLQLRRVEVTWTKGEDTGLFPLIEFLLKHASQLEKMVFRKRRSPKKYDVEVFFPGITASADEILRQLQI